LTYWAVEKRKKGEVFWKAMAEGIEASARAWRRMLTMIVAMAVACLRVVEVLDGPGVDSSMRRRVGDLGTGPRAATTRNCQSTTD
jgi:hypothetical protein